MAALCTDEDLKWLDVEVGRWKKKAIDKECGS